MAINLISGIILAAALLGCLADAKSIVPKYHPQIQTSTSNNPTQNQQSYNQQSGGQTQIISHDDEYRSCEVADSERILCGPPDISKTSCEDINCCYNGGQCYFGKMVTLHCTAAAEMILVVAREATVPSINLETIYLMKDTGPSCSAIGALSFVVYHFGVTQCGTEIKSEPGADVLIYENKLSSSFEVLTGNHGSITRDTTLEILFQCHYSATGVEAVFIQPLELEPPVSLWAPGPLRVELRLGNGECLNKGCVEDDAAYLSYYMDGDYPITKVLRDPVYVEVRILGRTDPALHLHLEQCWANTSPDSSSHPQWQLLNHGCPNPDDSYRTKVIDVDTPDLAFPSHYKRFVFRMFTFVNRASSPPGQKTKLLDVEVIEPVRQKVYIHCDCSVCVESSSNNCMTSCARKKRDIASARKMFRADRAIATSSQIIMTNGD